MKLLRFILWFSLSVVGLGAIFCLSSCNSTHSSDDYLTFEREVRHSIPIGSSVSDVEAYLRKRGLDFSFDKKTRAIYAMRHGERSFLTREDTTLVIKLDDNMKVSSIEINRVFTGP